MLVSPHLYSHLTTIEPECQVVVIDHVTHIKKKQSKGGDDMQVDEMDFETPMKDDVSETSRNKDVEISSPEKGDESTDVDEEKKGGCLIGF